MEQGKLIYAKELEGLGICASVPSNSIFARDFLVSIFQFAWINLSFCFLKQPPDRFVHFDSKERARRMKTSTMTTAMAESRIKVATLRALVARRHLLLFIEWNTFMGRGEGNTRIVSAGGRILEKLQWARTWNSCWSDTCLIKMDVYSSVTESTVFPRTEWLWGYFWSYVKSTNSLIIHNFAFQESHETESLIQDREVNAREHSTTPKTSKSPYVPLVPRKKTFSLPREHIAHWNFSSFWRAWKIPPLFLCVLCWKRISSTKGKKN